MNYLRLFLCYIFLIFISACSSKKNNSSSLFDLDAIQRKGKITILMDNSSLSFFEWRGKNMGFEYEILDSFAKYLGVKIEVKIIQNQNDFYKCINNGEGDIIACNQAITLTAKNKIDFSFPYYTTCQVLIQRKLIDSLIIKDPSKLALKDVYVTNGSAFDSRLKQLSNEIGEVINTRYFNSSPSAEDLIEMVASGKINYTMANENLARISNELHPNLYTQTVMSSKQKIAFGLRKDNPKLKNELNLFLTSFCSSTHFINLKKYFRIILISGCL